jgi:hypothetical protein
VNDHLISTASPEYLSTVEEWFKHRDEMIVLVRYVYCGGNTDIQLIPTFEAFRARLAQLRERDSVIVFRDHKLPLRGTVDDSFIERCLAAIPSGTEYVLVETELTTAGSQSWFHNDSGATHADLRESLDNSRGRAVLVGEYLPWLRDSEGVIAAYVPDSDGVVRPGAY